MASARRELAKIKKCFREHLERRAARAESINAVDLHDARRPGHEVSEATQMPQPVHTNVQQQIRILEEENSRCQAAIRRLEEDNQRLRKMLNVVCEQLFKMSDCFTKPVKDEPDELKVSRRMLARAGDMTTGMGNTLQAWLSPRPTEEDRRGEKAYEEQQRLAAERIEVAFGNSSLAPAKRPPSIVFDSDDEMVL